MRLGKRHLLHYSKVLDSAYRGINPLDLNQTGTSFDGIQASIFRSYSTRLAEVGRLKEKQPDEEHYPPGQPFVHRVFGYRGVTLFPWLARVNDYDLKRQYTDQFAGQTYNQVKETESHSDLDRDGHECSDHEDVESKQEDSEDENCNEGVEGPYVKFHPYYQVLIDIRDCPYVSNRTQTEAVTFLGHPNNSKSVYSIKGLDYVAHEDILPYTSHEDQPIHHELHNKLFKLNPDIQDDNTLLTTDKYLPSELLESWKNKHPWLELSRIYRETTENVRVTVIPFFLGHTTIDHTSFYWWRYSVRLENFNQSSVQLRERHWKIFSQTKMLETIKGRGVVGVEPLLTKSEPAYQYSSHVNLQDKSGYMWGTYKLEREDGTTFECKIPSVSLESTVDTITPPTSKRSS